ncbi:2659_t:CDS:2 [Paraglomus brasilianum]|uniref:2659_t:CDS:1 n=1 Tax=Paraglomus brasilianum TaxID=144538 RepID=A0A9N9CZS7_9GLOM|nr:2659_t:CDS:2 [Paraglomus brasilianum]
MGGGQSKPDVIVLYNETQVPIRRPRQPIPTSVSSNEIDQIVNARVAAELRRMQELDDEIFSRAEAQIRQEYPDSGVNSVVVERDIEELIGRIERKYENRGSAGVAEQRRAVIECYR